MGAASRSRKSANNIFATLVNKIALTFFPLVIRTIMIYQLGEQYVGLGSLFTSILGMLSITELGFGTAVIYNMYKPMAEHDIEKVNVLLNFYKKVYFTVGMLVLFLGMVLCPFIPNLINNGYPADINIYILYIIYLLNTVFGYLFWGYKKSILIAGQRNDIDSHINTAINMVAELTKIVLLILWPNYYVYVIILPLATILNNVIIAKVTDRLYPEYKAQGVLPKKEKIIIGKKVKALFFNKIGTIVLTSSDNIIISTFLGLSILAYYGNYYNIVYTVISMSYLVGGSITSVIANSIVEESVKKNKELYDTLSFWICMISGICFAGFYLLLQPLMKIWMGEDRLLNDSTVALLCIYFYTYQSRRTTIIFKDAAGLWETDQYRPIVSAVINLVVNIILVQLVGINGIIISTIVATVFVDIPWENWALFKFYFKENSKLYYVQQFKYCLTILIMTGISGWLCAKIRFGGILGLVMDSFVIGVVCILVLIFFWGKSNYIKNGVKYIKQAMRR